MLIEFYGLLSESSKNKYNKKLSWKISIVAIMGITAILLPFIIIFIFDNLRFISFVLIGIIALVALIFFAGCLLSGGLIESLEGEIRVVIEEDEIALATAQQAREHKFNLKEASGINSLSVDGYFITGHIKSILEVLKVIDYGDWYEIVFNEREKMLYGAEQDLVFHICQKDLIVTGTLDDFEKLFEGKIVRRTGK